MATEWLTDAQRLADDRLDGHLREFVRSRRERIPQASWRLIARELFEATGVDVSDQTVRTWFPEYQPKYVVEKAS
jgi:hypothetical protein